MCLFGELSGIYGIIAAVAVICIAGGFEFGYLAGKRRTLKKLETTKD